MDRRHRACFDSFVVVFSVTCLSAFADGNSILIGSGQNCVGRVQLPNGTRVCSEEWDLTDAMVVCRELKCGKAVGAGQSNFGEGSGSSWLNGVKCTGNENTLSSCKSEIGSTCSQKDAGVVCSGGVSKPNIIIWPSSEVKWGGTIRINCTIQKNIYAMTGGQLKLTKLSAVQKSKASSLLFSVPKVKFEDEGEYECCYTPGEGSVFCSSVSFTVTVDLRAPKISVSSDEQQRASDHLQVTRGNRFDIICSISGDYPEGRFSLWFSGSNRSVHDRSAVNHSASFHFPESRSEHQGEYRCEYRVTWASRNYTSPRSAGVQVTVRQPLLPVILPIIAVILVLLVVIGVYICYRRRRRRSETVTERVVTIPSPMTLNQYKEDEDEEEADYVNVSSGGYHGEGTPRDQSDDEPDYVNVVESHDNISLDIYGGDESIYQNY